MHRNNTLCKDCQDFLKRLEDWQVKFKKAIENGDCEKERGQYYTTCGRGWDFGWKDADEKCKCRRTFLNQDAYGDKSKFCSICRSEGITDPSQIAPQSEQSDNSGPKCQECSTPLITSAKVEYYSLSKNTNNKEFKEVCSSCYNKNQEKYKQNWEDIHKVKETYPYWPQINIKTTTWPHEYIQAKCREKDCGKKFDPQTAEKDRHKWEQNNELSDDDHEELNKNPAPVKTMEDLAKQWMGSMGYQKIYWDKEEKMWKIKKTDGKTLERWGVSLPGSWNDKLEKFLEEQSNKEIVVSITSPPPTILTYLTKLPNWNPR